MTNSSPSLTRDSGDLHNKRRQKFIYEALYRNTHSSLTDEIRSCIDSIRNDDLNPRLLVDAQASAFQEMFHLWMLEYTAGKELNILASQLPSIVDEFVRWNDANVPFRFWLREKFKGRGRNTDLTVCAVDFNNQTTYELTLQLLSVAILIRDGRSINRIVAAMASNRYQDALYEQLISGYVKDPQDEMEEVLHEEPYAILIESYFEENTESSVSHVQSYLKQWYRHQDGARWYDAHKKIRDDEAFYYGYWAFEAGATCYLLDIDDSGIDHMVYPKDLVAYGRKLRNEGRVTSDFDTPLALDEYPLSRLRCEAGQPCPQEGWWLTPAQTNSRRRFKQGDIMPAFEDSHFGSTIWQWDIDQTGPKR